MYDLAKSIQTEKRRQGYNQRLTASVSAKRSLSWGRYQLTFNRQANDSHRLP